MAEGFARHLKGNLIIPFSAGIEAKGLDSCAVEVMKEIGIDISGQQSKTIKDLGNLRKKDERYIIIEFFYTLLTVTTNITANII